MAKHRAFIGIGSNLNNPLLQVNTAIKAMQTIPQTEERIRCSSWYESEALGGPAEQPNYINGVAELWTALSPIALLEQLQKIEKQQHRVRDIHWGPRTLDLDILLFDDQVMTDPQLTIPHPELQHRDFVLIPLAELEPNLTLPTHQQTLATLIMQLETTNNLRKL